MVTTLLSSCQRCMGCFKQIRYQSRFRYLSGEWNQSTVLEYEVGVITMDCDLVVGISTRTLFRIYQSMIGCIP